MLRGGFGHVSAVKHRQGILAICSVNYECVNSESDLKLSRLMAKLNLAGDCL